MNNIYPVIIKNRHTAGQLAIMFCAILWSTSGLTIKLIDWHPAVITGGRCFLAIFVLLVMRPYLQPKKQPIKAIPLLSAGIWYAATMILFVNANKLTASANVIMLQYAAPLWACFMGWYFLKEKPQVEHWFALLFVGLGMFLVFYNGLAGGSLLGDSLALLSGIAFAANSIALRKHKDSSPVDVLIASYIICVMYSIPFFFLYPPHITTGSIIGILYMGLLQIGVASAFFIYGIKHVTAVQSMLTSAIEPVLNPLWVLIVTGEKPALLVIAGGCIIMSAVIFSSLMGRRRALQQNS
ncbi:MAG: DMT family transporter [Treponema sp.]|nr:DMT family transporter [Treponema sp.]